MLGLIRGNVYYNMISWYRCLTCIPVGDTSKYMETMMGVKQVTLLYMCICVSACMWRVSASIWRVSARVSACMWRVSVFYVCIISH